MMIESGSADACKPHTEHSCSETQLTNTISSASGVNQVLIRMQHPQNTEGTFYTVKCDKHDIDVDVKMREPSQLSGNRSQWRCQRSKGARLFRGQKILQPGHPDALFSSKKSMTFFSSHPSKHRLPTPFHHQNKTNKAVRYGKIFIFCSHYYRSKAIRRAEPGLEPGQWIFQPGNLTGRALV